MTIHGRVKRERKKQRLSQEELATKVGIPLPTYASFEQGRVKNPRYAERLAKALGKNMVWLFQGENTDDEEDHVSIDLPPNQNSDLSALLNSRQTRPGHILLEFRREISMTTYLKLLQLLEEDQTTTNG